ncbi:MAG: carbon-nitrogen hydrolase family protein, partial [Dehalococcoidia bacterium]
MKLALVQMHCPKGEIDANLTAIEAHIDRAVVRAVDVICFPEMSITGYINPERQPEAVLSLASPAIARLTAMTAGRSITVLAGLVEANAAGRPFITQVAVRSGRTIGVYRKTTIPADEAPWFDPGAGVPAFAEAAPAFAMSICADIEEPNVFATAARNGARIVFEAAAPGLYGEQATRDWQAGFDWWRSECHTKLGRYAREQGIFIAVATQAGRTVDEDFPGGGYLFGPDGRCIVASADGSPGVL